MVYSRYKRIFDNADQAVDVVLIANRDRVDPNFFYITGYTGGLFESSYALLYPDLHVEVLTSRLEADIARLGPHPVHVPDGYTPSDWMSSLRKLVGDAARVGVNFRGITHSDYLALSEGLGGKALVDVSGALQRARMVKDPDELERIERAARITSETVDSVPDMLREGMTEKELQAKIEHAFVERGADSPSFQSIVAFGENTALPHYAPQNRKLRRGEPVLVDVGAKYRLYCADQTRTFFYGGVTQRQRQMYETVLEAQNAALKMVRKGVEGRAVHLTAAQYIDNTVFRGRFTHGLGHSLGLEVHDGAGFSATSQVVLDVNMVLTVEPGVYVVGEGGVRIEDDIAVTQDGYKMFTTTTRELVSVG
ncbi:MAG: Xaa-Pro peptidase family protein [Thermoprotei archaeon]